MIQLVANWIGIDRIIVPLFVFLMPLNGALAEAIRTPSGDDEATSLTNAVHSYFASVKYLKVSCTTTSRTETNQELFLMRGEKSYFQLKSEEGESRVYCEPSRTVSVLQDKYGRASVSVSKSEPDLRPTILAGMFARDHRPIHVRMLELSTATFGREQLDGVNCATVVLAEDSRISVKYFFDPTHDYLCRRRVFLVAGKEWAVWNVLEFTQSSGRWFPKKVTSITQTSATGNTPPEETLTEVVNVEINVPFDDTLVDPVIPDGAAVRDETGQSPSSYVHGSIDAYKQKAELAAAQRAVEKAPTGDQEPIRVTPKSHRAMLFAIGGGIFIMVGIALLYKAKVKAH